jgi:hypothetical protein
MRTIRTIGMLLGISGASLFAQGTAKEAASPQAPAEKVEAMRTRISISQQKNEALNRILTSAETARKLSAVQEQLRAIENDPEIQRMAQAYREGMGRLASDPEMQRQSKTSEEGVNRLASSIKGQPAPTESQDKPGK